MKPIKYSETLLKRNPL